MPLSQINYFDEGSLRAVGDISERNLDQLRSYLENQIVVKSNIKIGPDHINFFAEGLSGKGNEPDSWFIEGNGVIYNLNEPDFSKEEAEEIRSRFNQIKSDIHALADQYKDQKEEKISTTLKNALKIPSEESLYAGEFQDEKTKKWYKSPVIINWGFEKKEVADDHSTVLVGDGQKLLPIADTAINDPPSIPENQPELEVYKSFKTKPSLLFLKNSNVFWAIWILVAILIAVIIYLLIPACGLKNNLQAQQCYEILKLNQNDQPNDELINRIQKYEKDLLFLKKKCTAHQPSSQSEPIQDEDNGIVVPQNVEERLKAENATIGDLNFSLVWNNSADLDLIVSCPDGKRISHTSKNNSCGTLDVDANVGASRKPDPVEHILINNPVAGSYNVSVRLYAKNGISDNKVIFQLEINSKTQNKSLQGDVITNMPWSYNFNYVGIK